MNFLGGSDGKSIRLQWGRTRFNSWVRKIPWRRKWQPTPGLLPGKSHGQRRLVGYNPWGPKESDTTERLNFHFLTLVVSEREYLSWCFSNLNSVRIICLLKLSSWKVALFEFLSDVLPQDMIGGQVSFTAPPLPPMACEYSEPDSTCFKVVLESGLKETALLPVQLWSSGNESYGKLCSWIIN